MTPIVLPVACCLHRHGARARDGRPSRATLPRRGHPGHGFDPSRRAEMVAHAVSARLSTNGPAEGERAAIPDKSETGARGGLEPPHPAEATGRYSDSPDPENRHEWPKARLAVGFLIEVKFGDDRLVVVSLATMAVSCRPRSAARSPQPLKGGNRHRKRDGPFAGSARPADCRGFDRDKNLATTRVRDDGLAIRSRGPVAGAASSFGTFYRQLIRADTSPPV
jgi:hypothetical protein